MYIFDTMQESILSHVELPFKEIPLVNFLTFERSVHEAFTVSTIEFEVNPLFIIDLGSNRNAWPPRPVVKLSKNFKHNMQGSKHDSNTT